MAIAFGQTGAQTGTTATITATVTIVGGSTVEIDVAITPETVIVLGTSVGARRVGFVINGTLRQEKWVTGAGAAAPGTQVVVTLSAAPTDCGVLVQTYTGVLGIGNCKTATGSGANPSIAFESQDANNYMAAGFGILNTNATTAGTGTLRNSDGNISLSDASTDNTAASPGTITNSITHSAGTWAAIVLELRTVKPIPPADDSGTDYPKPPITLRAAA